MPVSCTNVGYLTLLPWFAPNHQGQLQYQPIFFGLETSIIIIFPSHACKSGAGGGGARCSSWRRASSLRDLGPLSHRASVGGSVDDEEPRKASVASFISRSSGSALGRKEEL